MTSSHGWVSTSHDVCEGLPDQKGKTAIIEILRASRRQGATGSVDMICSETLLIAHADQ